MNNCFFQKNKGFHFKAAVIAIIITGVLFGVSSVSASPNVSFFRSIDFEHLNTLNLDSKWRQDSLNLKLYNVLSEDLTGNITSQFEQVWYFSAEDFEDIKTWCLEREKGVVTNKDFISKYSDHQIK